MAFINTIKNTLIRLINEDSYWQVIFSKQGWDYSLNEIVAMSDDMLKTHLLNDVLHVDRSVKGFEDFSLLGKKMVEPGNPVSSLLYHALVSPNIYYKENISEHLNAFPTLFEIDALENFIYALKPLDIDDLIQKEGANNVAIGVFSYEYRQAINTTHKKHADLCFSRTGIARVGTDVHKYEPNLRAFTTFLDSMQQKGM